ncbi:histidine kinase [Streptomyces sp. NBC_01351]|uniref:sensor histidine kinase n=1 Tax=Streptomyces sp. NBC_01351 TaxID=2903833 RepID=UPI002E2EB38F|nr:histidine kinase [Streptomyces sp. NBC_01351]
MTLKPSALYAPALTAAALLSLLGSAVRVPDTWTLAGMAVLLPLLALVARWSPVRSGRLAGTLGVTAVTLWPVPLIWADGSWLEIVGAAAFWALPALGAVTAGGYLRRQAGRLEQAVRNARRDQQLELARDLHDFVAHDVSAIVVRAQAARFVAAQDPGQAVLALERIEAAGLSALASMDRTVHALQEAAGGPLAPVPGLAELPGLVDRFEGGALDVDPAVVGELSREADTTAYRVAVEALTNVRRHGPGAAVVRVSVRRAGAGIEVSVANSAPGRGVGQGLRGLGRRRRGGTGLAGLRGRVEAAGGTLRAGASADGGWLVSAVFPAAPPSQG